MNNAPQHSFRLRRNGRSMDFVEAFIRRYVKEYGFYDQAARLVRDLLETSLRTSGVRCLVTSRAKDVARLEDKARRRAARKNYTCAEDVFEDIPDLAGVRVALYFPGERDQVDVAVRRLFDLTELPKEFPDKRKVAPEKRFTGYSAKHYRIRLKEDTLGESDRRYTAAKVEIQVASVLMHAWSEVEHDLVYKPLDGEVSQDEHEILDQLNGMVIAGEIALETLQRAGKRRVAESGGTFRNHYELAAYLLAKIKSTGEEPIDEAGLGRVDLLYALVKKMGVDGPAQLDPHLGLLHDDLETRPLAEQVIDAFIAEDEKNLEIYREVQSDADRLGWLRVRSALGDEPRDVERFLDYWSELENLARDFVRPTKSAVHASPVMALVRMRDVPLDPTERSDLGSLRRLRNNLVHRTVRVPSEELARATNSLREIIEKLHDNLPGPAASADS